MILIGRRLVVGNARWKWGERNRLIWGLGRLGEKTSTEEGKVEMTKE